MALYPDSLGNELILTRFYEDERIKLTGQSVTYYWINLSVNVDPLYDEPYNMATTAGWDYTSYTMVMAVEFQEMDNNEDSAMEEGFLEEFDATAFISYTEWSTNGEPNLPPKVGDVVFCMNKYFDIVSADSGGNLVDTPNAVGWKLMLKDKSKFTPDRKTNP